MSDLSVAQPTLLIYARTRSNGGRSISAKTPTFYSALDELVRAGRGIRADCRDCGRVALFSPGQLLADW